METRGRGDGGSDDGGESDGKACGEKKRENEGAIAVLLSKMRPNNSSEPAKSHRRQTLMNLY